MFLGAGSVMHGMNDDVDMRHYGGLRKVMPVTFLTFSMGYLAIIGFPRLLRVLVEGQDHRGGARPEHASSACCAMIGAGITGFYMTRLMFMTFFSQKRWADDVHPHESPKVMTIPLIVLAALLGLRRRDARSATGSSTSSSRSPAPRRRRAHRSRRWWSRSSSSLIVAVGVAVAWFVVGQQRGARARRRRTSRWPVRAARAELYGNEVNDELVDPARRSPRVRADLRRPPRRRRGRRGRRPRGRRASARSAGGSRPASSAPTPCPCSSAPSSSSWPSWR